MAPNSAAAARPLPQHHARRPLSRIVPAIPHRLSRPAPPARPMTPADSHTGAVGPKPPAPPPEEPLDTADGLKEELDAADEPNKELNQAAERKQELNMAAERKKELNMAAEPRTAEEHTAPEDPPAAAVQTPPTPESRASGDRPVAGADAGTPVLAATPSTSQDCPSEPIADAHAEPHPRQQAPDHTSPPAPAGDSKPLANGAHRKALPPPFYPSNMSGMHTPVADAHGSTFRPAPPPADGAVAGPVHDAQHSPAQPVTPQGYDAIGHARRQSVPRIPPGFAPPDFTPSFFPGHAHHPSDAGAPWLYPPYSMPPPPEPLYANGSDFQSPPFSAGPSVFPDPYHGHFSPDDSRFATNGVATSHSQSPSKSQFGEPLPIADRAELQHAQPQQNGAMAMSEEMSESPFELASYLSTQFGNPEFADFVLQLRSPEFQYISIPVHGIVVVRSPVVANAVRRSIPPAHRSRDARRLIDVLTTNPFLAAESVQEAIKVLYGAPLLSMQAFLYGLGHYTLDAPHAHITKDARRRMDQLLSYIAAGSVLQIPSMQARGVEIAKALLRWDTVEQVLHYGLQAAKAASPPNADASDIHDPFAAELLNAAIDFIAFNFPSDFNLYRIASELRNDPRLPSLAEAHAPTHNPRLSKIRFGDTPVDDEAHATPVSRTLSSILLSLPLPLIDRLFNHRATANQIGWTGAAKALHDVVDERENRRQKVVRGQLQLDGTAPSSLLDNLYVEERVDHVGASPLHPSGYMASPHRANGLA